MYLGSPIITCPALCAAPGPEVRSHVTPRTKPRHPGAKDQKWRKETQTTASQPSHAQWNPDTRDNMRAHQSVSQSVSPSVHQPVRPSRLCRSRFMSLPACPRRCHRQHAQHTGWRGTPKRREGDDDAPEAPAAEAATGTCVTCPRSRT